LEELSYEEFVKATEELQLKRQGRITKDTMEKVKEFVRQIRTESTIDEKRRIKALKRRKQKCRRK